MLCDEYAAKVNTTDHQKHINAPQKNGERAFFIFTLL